DFRLPQLWMQIVKLVGAGGRAELAEREIDKPHPDLSHRLVIAAVQTVGYLECQLQSLQTFAHSADCIVHRHPSQVKIGNFNVLAMAPIVRCDLALLKALEEGFVVHDNLEDGGDALVRGEHIVTLRANQGRNDWKKFTAAGAAPRMSHTC